MQYFNEVVVTFDLCLPNTAPQSVCLYITSHLQRIVSSGNLSVHKAAFDHVDQFIIDRIVGVVPGINQLTNPLRYIHTTLFRL